MRVFLAYGTPLTEVSSFRYLGQTLSSTDDNWSEVERNLRRARVKWGRMANILVIEVADKRMVGKFYVVVVQAVLLFGSGAWVLTPCLDKSLEGCHHQAAWRMAGMGHKRQWDRTWVYPPIVVALEMVGLEEIGVYIARRQNMVAQYIAICPIMDLCLAAEKNPKMCLYRRWWEQTALDIMGIRIW